MSETGDDPEIEDQDIARWQALAGTVTPLENSCRDRVAAVRPRNMPLSRRPAPVSVNTAGCGPGVPINNSKQIRRGRVYIDGRLDMHGLRADRARMMLTEFVRSGAMRGHRCLLVVTGKGRLSEGVLRSGFPEWLSAHGCREYVSSYAPAHRSHGGGGAWYVFVRPASVPRK